MTCFSHPHLLHHLVGELCLGDCPVLSRYSNFASQLCWNSLTQCFMNLSNVGVLKLVATKSSVRLKQPISITPGYMMSTVCIALPFTDARSLMPARSFVLAIPSSVERTVRISRASSSPVMGLANNSSRTRRCSCQIALGSTCNTLTKLQ